MIPKVSIIIPVYNTREYLTDCLDSVCNQTESNIEIIIVDDASTDHSWELIQKYAAKDTRIIAIRHEHNKRQGAARNTGINAASAEYVWFVDSDDFIDIHACNILYHTAKKEEVDILFFSLCPCTVDTNNGMTIAPELYFVHPKRILYHKFSHGSANEFWSQLEQFPVSPPAYISKLQLLQHSKFREGVFHEDTDFTPKLFFNAESIYGIYYTPYYRRFREGSVMASVSDKRKKDTLLAALEILEFCRKKGISRWHYLAQQAKWSIQESPILTELNSEQIQLQRLAKKLYEQLPGRKAQYFPVCVPSERWLRFGRLSCKRKIWVIIKVMSKKLKIYSLLQPLAEIVKKYWRAV